MTLIDKLEELASTCNPWDKGDYILPIADLRDLLEQAAKRLRELEQMHVRTDR